MIFEYAVKHNGINYPAGTDVPLDVTPEIKVPVIEDEPKVEAPKAETPKAAPKKRATKK